MDSTPELSAAEFDKLAQDVWSRLLTIIPKDLKSNFNRIRILIEDAPTADFLKDAAANGEDELVAEADDLCGFFIGVPMTDSLVSVPELFPARVYLFRRALMDMADFDGTPAAIEDLREEIAVTLLHEVGHFFGLDEDDLERLGFD